MAVSTNYQNMFAGMKFRGLMVEATSTVTGTTNVKYEDMQGYSEFGVVATVASSTGAINALNIVTATSSTGENQTTVISHGGPSSADAIGDYVVLSVGAADAASTDTDARYFGATVQATTVTHVHLMYLKAGGPRYKDQTAGYAAT